MSDSQWESLRVPVDMAFFFYSTPAERVVAYYPSPMGPTESLLTLEAWEELEGDNPVLKGMERDVEALLVNRARGASEHFLVPLDECYKLVGLIRTRWRGFSGGREVWDDITEFFEDLRRRAKTVRRRVEPRREEQTHGGHKGRKAGHEARRPRAHTGGQGRQRPRRLRAMPGHLPDGKATAERSTGINARVQEPHRPEQPEPVAGLTPCAASACEITLLPPEGARGNNIPTLRAKSGSVREGRPYA